MSKIGTEEMIERLGKHWGWTTWDDFKKSLSDPKKKFERGDIYRDAIIARLKAADELAKASRIFADKTRRNSYQDDNFLNALNAYEES